eukprot:TRINITY_DN13572_c0_g1_i4.p1 TRINITY_DN13572_c0_g1~~TRINITY_DN13572_c0_g1_i4.p1  ORF type:complete len:234 (-),score=4.09 TRINITY_DN13572_c0_g1_i4:175-876(-)
MALEQEGPNGHRSTCTTVLNLVWSFCCSCGHSRGENEQEAHESAEGCVLLAPSGAGPSKHKAMSPQELLFSKMRVPSFTTIAQKHKRSVSSLADEDNCAICLEEFSDGNPKTHLQCGHGFHLGCILEWEERGKTECPICDLNVGSVDESQRGPCSFPFFFFSAMWKAWRGAQPWGLRTELCWPVPHPNGIRVWPFCLMQGVHSCFCCVKRWGRNFQSTALLCCTWIVHRAFAF